MKLRRKGFPDPLPPPPPPHAAWKAWLSEREAEREVHSPSDLATMAAKDEAAGVATTAWLWDRLGGNTPDPPERVRFDAATAALVEGVDYVLVRRPHWGPGEAYVRELDTPAVRERDAAAAALAARWGRRRKGTTS